MVSVQNFATEEIYDSEGVRIPAEAMLMITLADHRRIAVRPSGTEPKIKYYMFAAQKPAKGQPFTAEELAAIKTKVASSIQSLWETLKADADARLK